MTSSAIEGFGSKHHHDWLERATLWKRHASSASSTKQTQVASGPLAIVVSQAMATHPVDREEFHLTVGSSHRRLDWDEIYELTREPDYPFNM